MAEPNPITIADRLTAAAHEAPRGVREAVWVEQRISTPPPPYDTYLQLGLGERGPVAGFLAMDHINPAWSDRPSAAGAGHVWIVGSGLFCCSDRGEARAADVRVRAIQRHTCTASSGSVPMTS
jgi:hypothetical protein